MMNQIGHVIGAQYQRLMLLLTNSLNVCRVEAFLTGSQVNAALMQTCLLHVVPSI